jgi:hypothetical protein
MRDSLCLVKGSSDERSRKDAADRAPACILKRLPTSE